MVIHFFYQLCVRGCTCVHCVCVCLSVCLCECTNECRCLRRPEVLDALEPESQEVVSPHPAWGLGTEHEV